jgi:uncharacterized protein YjiS (DUF1127 family)
MIAKEMSATARLPAAGVWVGRGEGLARAGAAASRQVGGWLWRAYAAMGRSKARRDAKRALYALDDRLLQDIGLRREQVAGIVDDMFRHDAGIHEVKPVRNVNAGQTADVAVTDASNDRRFESAA